MNVDVIGTDNVVQYIKASGKSKFSIFRAGINAGERAVPVFESLQHNTVNNAVGDFKAWADLIQNNLVYRMSLFDIIDTETDENGNTKYKKKTGTLGKTDFIFAINTPNQYFDQDKGKPVSTGPAFDLSSLRADIVKEITQKQEESAILRKLAEMQNEITALKAERDQDEEEEETGGLGSIMRPETLAGITALANALKGGTPPPAIINGPAEATSNEDKIHMLNNAVKRLYKHDPDLHADLTLLADMAEQKPDTFKFMIQTLRSGGI